MHALTRLALAILVVMLAPPPPASAARGETLLVSRASGPSGAASDGDSNFARISADGRFVVFLSHASNLSPDANPAYMNVFLRDTQTGATTLVSRATGVAGAGADDDCGNPTVSADGRFVAFDSFADDLSPDDSNSFQNVFVRDTMTNTTILVSRAAGASGAAANDASFSPAISADGHAVAFVSRADNLSADANILWDNVFVRDLVTNTVTFVSRATGPAGTGGDGASDSPSISSDGRFVAFESHADDLSSEDDNTLTNVFVRDTLMNTTVLVSRATGAAGAAANLGSYFAAISADGRYVAFQSGADNLSPDDNDIFQNVFVRDLTTATTVLVSRADGASGVGGDNNSYKPSISADGRFVAFESGASNLSPAATDAYEEVFVRDLTSNTTTLVSRVSGFGPVADNHSYSYGFALSGDGRFVTYESLGNNLSAEDNDAVDNVFRFDLRGGPPHCVDLAQTVVREDPSAVTLMCVDDDGDPVTRAIVAGPAHGSVGAVDQTAGTVTYTPNPGYTGPDTFTFQASDPSGSSPVATATLTVAGCTAAATFASVECRLDELERARAGGLPAGKLATKLGKLLAQARARVAAAEGLGHTGKARKGLGKAAKALGAFGHALGGKAAKKLDPATVASLKAAAAALRQDVSALRG
jgi:Tol biopolymer transport system component